MNDQNGRPKWTTKMNNQNQRLIGQKIEGFGIERAWMSLIFFFEKASFLKAIVSNFQSCKLCKPQNDPQKVQSQRVWISGEDLSKRPDIERTAWISTPDRFYFFQGRELSCALFIFQTRTPIYSQWLLAINTIIWFQWTILRILSIVHWQPIFSPKPPISLINSVCQIHLSVRLLRQSIHTKSVDRPTDQW